MSPTFQSEDLLSIPPDYVFPATFDRVTERVKTSIDSPPDTPSMTSSHSMDLDNELEYKPVIQPQSYQFPSPFPAVTLNPLTLSTPPIASTDRPKLLSLSELLNSPTESTNFNRVLNRSTGPMRTPKNSHSPQHSRSEGRASPFYSSVSKRASPDADYSPLSKSLNESKRRRNLPPQTVSVLKAWLERHIGKCCQNSCSYLRFEYKLNAADAYPSEQTKRDLAEETGLTVHQVGYTLMSNCLFCHHLIQTGLQLVHQCQKTYPTGYDRRVQQKRTFKLLFQYSQLNLRSLLSIDISSFRLCLP